MQAYLSTNLQVDRYNQCTSTHHEFFTAYLKDEKRGFASIDVQWQSSAKAVLFYCHDHALV